jgi:hypothetical protein
MDRVQIMQSAFHRMSTWAMVKGTRYCAAEHDSETVSTSAEVVAWRFSEAVGAFITSCR